jgi:CheY-like chemotaxis protein
MPRILVIDDDAHVRDMLRQALERVGYEVACAADAEAATALYQDKKTDLIITDIVMPEKDGMEVITEFKRNLPETKIIAISGGAKIGPYSYLMMAQRLGADKIFAKPVDRGELLAAVQQLLNPA